MLLFQVGKPLLGEVVPRCVKCTAEVDVSRFTGDILAEWEGLRERDGKSRCLDSSMYVFWSDCDWVYWFVVVFLVCVDRPHPDCNNKGSDGQSFGRDVDAVPVEQNAEDELKMFGIRYIRGGEVFEVRDEDDVVLNDYSR
jgi:hypothetical protein